MRAWTGLRQGRHGCGGQGAADNVLPPHLCGHIPLVITERSASGVGFRSADGGHIRHHGERRIPLRLTGGVAGASTWQVADVRRPLLGAARIVQAVNTLHLDADNPRLVRSRGDVVPLRCAGNVLLIDFWVAGPAAQSRPTPRSALRKTTVLSRRG